MAKKVSMKDIANRVGVSTALVSYVLNGLEKEKRVGPELVEKIRSVAKEMKYKPNQIARSLRKGSTNTVGFIVADIANPFFGQLARIIEDEAVKLGYTVIFGSSDEDYLKFGLLIDTLVNRQVDGIIIVPTEGCSEQIKSLKEENIPIVSIDRYLPGITTNHVILDNYKATNSAVKYFISKGYKNINMIAYESSLGHMQERIRGYREAMEENGLAKELFVKKVRYDHLKHDMVKIMDELMNEKKIDALLFATNAISISGLYTLMKNDIKVPDQIAVIGFDGHEVFDFYKPQISYIKQPLEDMGKEAINILVDQIKGSPKTVHIELKSQLVVRGSCG